MVFSLGVVFTSLLAVSCSDNNGIEDITGPEPGFITIDLSSSSETRADEEPGVNSLNENLISTALISLFPSTATDDDSPVLIQPVSFMANTHSTATVKLRINRDLIPLLFPSGNSTAKAYVIANLPSSSNIPENPTLGSLKSIVIGSDFDTRTIQPSFVMDGSDNVNLEYNASDPSKSKITGKINLNRVAAKINLAVKVAATVTDGNNIEWESLPEDMTVHFTNGVKRSAVTPSGYTPAAGDYYNIPSTRARKFDKTEAEDYPFVLQNPFYTYPNSWSELNDSENENMTYMTLIVPWKKSGENNYRYCYYTVPVVKGNQIVRNVAYQVNINVGILGSFTQDSPMPLEDLSYKAVDWGLAPVGVEINDYRYLVLDKTDYVLNNQASTTIPFYSTHDVVVTDAKVTYYLYNFTPQGNEEPVTITTTQNNNSTATIDGEEQHIYSTTVDNSIDPVTSTRSVTFNHPLYQWTPYDRLGNRVVLNGENGSYPTASLSYLIETIDKYVITDKEPFSRYDIELTIVHSDKIGKPDEAAFTRTIRITQYPSIYIEATQNYYSSTSANNTPQRGNVYVNNNQANRVSQQSTPDIQSWVSITNNLPASQNSNMYVITITNLNDNTYRIGDPRETTIDNLYYNNNTGGYLYGYTANTDYMNTVSYRWQEAPALSGTSPRRLSYYYPADSSETFMYMLAPKIRVSSYYSQSRGVRYRAEAEQRCAGYQEMNYPAGRWRLPTLGELQYIMNLWNENKIPPLFQTTGAGRYWTAQGHVSAQLVDGKLDSSNLQENLSNVYAYIRCVYDEWYWNGKPTVTSTGSETYDGVEYNHYPFTWGDAPM